MNFCRFTFAVGQSFSSIVRPVSVSRDVDGQRTSKLLILGGAFFGFGRGGSKRNRVVIYNIYLEPVNDPRLGGIVGRHFHFHTVANCQADKTFAHFARNVREHEMVVRQRDPEHRPWQDAHNGAFEADCFFRIHYADVANSAALT